MDNTLSSDIFRVSAISRNFIFWSYETILCTSFTVFWNNWPYRVTRPFSSIAVDTTVFKSTKPTSLYFRERRLKRHWFFLIGTENSYFSIVLKYTKVTLAKELQLVSQLSARHEILACIVSRLILSRKQICMPSVMPYMCQARDSLSDV